MLTSACLLLLIAVAQSRVFTPCELAHHLQHEFKVDESEVAMWVCIASKESSLNTSAVGRLNWDGSADHGLFQLSDKYWCKEGGGGACNMDCASLRDDDLADDWACVKRIYKEHTRLSGDGYTAWAVYPSCKGGEAASTLRRCSSESNSLPLDRSNSLPHPTSNSFPHSNSNSFPHSSSNSFLHSISNSLRHSSSNSLPLYSSNSLPLYHPNSVPLYHSNSPHSSSNSLPLYHSLYTPTHSHVFPHLAHHSYSLAARIHDPVFIPSFTPHYRYNIF